MDANELLKYLDVLENPSEWDLLPLLERLHAGEVPFSIRQRPHLTHGATEVVSVNLQEQGVFIVQQFFGLADPASPLPEPYVERAVLEARNEGSGPWRDLLDILSERFVIEDWRAWRARYGGIADSSGMPRPASDLLDEARGQALSAAIVSSGFLAHGVWSPAVLGNAVAILTGARCEVREFEPEWISLPESGGVPDKHKYPVLGHAVIGDRVLAIDGSAVVALEAESWDAFESFLSDPRESDLGRLLVMAGEGKVSCTVILRSRSSPKSSLMDSEKRPGSALGIDSWLQSDNNLPDDYTCEVSLPQASKWRGT